MDQLRQALAFNCGFEKGEDEYRCTVVGAEILETEGSRPSEGGGLGGSHFSFLAIVVVARTYSAW